jgi:protein-tyrosine phosphatase
MPGHGTTRMLSSVLRHPAMQPLKRAIRNLWWRYRGRSIANPPLPKRVQSVMFVCLGNICRSPFAEVIAARRAESLAPGLRFTSSGIRTTQAAAPPHEAKRAAKAFGVSLERHQPQLLTRDLMAAHDMIVVMEGRQMELLQARYPDLRDRIFLLSLFEDGVSGFERYTIPDPFGLPHAIFEACYRRIDHAVVAMLVSLGVYPAAGRRGSKGLD